MVKKRVINLAENQSERKKKKKTVRQFFRKVNQTGLPSHTLKLLLFFPLIKLPRFSCRVLYVSRQDMRSVKQQPRKTSWATVYQVQVPNRSDTKTKICFKAWESLGPDLCYVIYAIVKY